MCGACASSGNASTSAARPSLHGGQPPPPSPYYQTQVRRRPSRPALFLKNGWPLALVAAVVAAGFLYFGDRAGIGPAIQDIPLEEQMSLTSPPGWSPPLAASETSSRWGENGTSEAASVSSTQKQSFGLKLLHALTPGKISPPPQQVGVPLGMNLTRRAEPYWKGLRELLLLDNSTAEDGPWFKDVYVDTIRIAEMWGNVEPPTDETWRRSGGLSPKEYELMEGYINTRKALLHNVSVEFSWFLGNQTAMAQNFLRKGGVFPTGAAHSFLSDDISEENLQELGPRLHNLGETKNSSGNNSISTLTLLDFKNWNENERKEGAAVARNIHHVMREVVRQHTDIVAPLELAGVGTVGSIIERICHVTLPAVRAVEAHFVPRLAAVSYEGGVQSERKIGHATRELEERICGIDRRHTDMRRALTWLQERFSGLRTDEYDIDDEDRGEKVVTDNAETRRYLDSAVIRDGDGKKKEVPELLIWVQSAVELLEAWATVLMDVQEGLLISMRKRELKKQALKVRLDKHGKILIFGTEKDYEKSWDDWKQRNCGATSCYKLASPAARVTGVFKNEKLAADARDEREQLGWDVPIWKGIYEEACCHKGQLAEILKYGSKVPEFPLVRLDDEELQENMA